MVFLRRRPMTERGLLIPSPDGLINIGAPFGVSKPIFRCAEHFPPTGRAKRRPIASHTVTATERPPEPGKSGDEGPPPGFFTELADAFRRHRPQGSARWNFADAFGRLESRFGGGRTGSDPAAPPATGRDVERSVGGPPPDRATTSLSHRLFDRTVADRLQPWIDERAATAARKATEEALADGPAGGFDATIEAFRFLAARVEGLETRPAARRAPLDAMAWLIPPPDLSGWAGPVSAWVAENRVGGEVLHGECGDGTLTAALEAAGVEVRGAEPRGTVAWAAAERGVDVHVGPTEELLATVGTGTLGAVVLSGVVDRLAVEDLVALLQTATDRLADGAPLVVVSTVPGAATSGWDAVARDLLPGRPLHPETWELLLARAGYEDVGSLSGHRDEGTYAVRGRRPR